MREFCPRELYAAHQLGATGEVICNQKVLKVVKLKPVISGRPSSPMEAKKQVGPAKTLDFLEGSPLGSFPGCGTGTSDAPAELLFSHLGLPSRQPKGTFPPEIGDTVPVWRGYEALDRPHLHLSAARGFSHSPAVAVFGPISCHSPSAACCSTALKRLHPLSSLVASLL